MKRAVALAALLLAVRPAPAHALFGDEAILAMQYAEDKTFHAFMQLQIVQEIATLKANYDASVRYYNEFRQLNSGKGLFQNVAARITAAQEQETESFKAQLADMAKPSTGSGSSVDDFFQSLDHAIANNIKYAGDEAANLVANRKLGENISNNADGLSPKDAANLTAKAEGIQIQMEAQQHQDNLRIIQLLSMQLQAQAQQQGSQASMIQGLRASLRTRAPGFTPDNGGDQ